MLNPKKKHKKRAHRKHRRHNENPKPAKRRSNPRRPVAKKRPRKNPISARATMHQIEGVIPVAIGGVVGIIAARLAGNLPMFAKFSGYPRAGIEALAGIVGGMLIEKLTGKRAIAQGVMAGGIATAIMTALNTALPGKIPGLSDTAYYIPGDMTDYLGYGNIAGYIGPEGIVTSYNPTYGVAV